MYKLIVFITTGRITKIEVWQDGSDLEDIFVETVKDNEQVESTGWLPEYIVVYNGQSDEVSYFPIHVNIHYDIYLFVS